MNTNPELMRSGILNWDPPNCVSESPKRPESSPEGIESDGTSFSLRQGESQCIWVEVCSVLPCMEPCVSLEPRCGTQNVSERLYHKPKKDTEGARK